jgi:hypothetical protein
MRKLLIGWITRVLVEPSLLYLAILGTRDQGMVQVNKISAGPLMYSARGEGPTAPTDVSVDGVPDTIDGVVFSTTRSPSAGTSILGAMIALSPLPAGLPARFRMVADFFMPPQIGPWPIGVQWAAVVGILNVNVFGDSSFTLAGATHQVRNLNDATEPNPGTVKIALGAGGGPTAGTITPPPRNELIEVPVAYPDARRDFRLETDIKLNRGEGVSRLRTPGHTWTTRTWQFGPANFPQVKGIGFGQAFPSGVGTATVTATAFRIYSLDLRSSLGFLLVGLLSDAPPRQL